MYPNFRTYNSTGTKNNPNSLKGFLNFQGHPQAGVRGRQEKEIKAVKAIIKLKNSSGKGIFNLGSSKPRKLKEYILIICNEINKNIKPNFGKIPYRKDQVMILYPDITKIKKVANWSPEIEFQYGIKNLLDYYHEN